MGEKVDWEKRYACLHAKHKILARRSITFEMGHAGLLNELDALLDEVEAGKTTPFEFIQCIKYLVRGDL